MNLNHTQMVFDNASLDKLLISLPVSEYIELIKAVGRSEAYGDALKQVLQMVTLLDCGGKEANGQH